MIPIDKCRKILEDNGETGTDKEIQEMKEFLLEMAKIALESYKNSKNEKANDKNSFSIRKS